MILKEASKNAMNGARTTGDIRQGAQTIFLFY